MAEFKKLSAVEAVETVADTVNVLIEENGVIKKAPKTAVGSVKELVYEWNFSADDEVYELAENVNDDLTWLTERVGNTEWELEVSSYACWYNNETDDRNIEPDLSTISVVTSQSSYYTGHHSNNSMKTYFCSEEPADFYNLSKEYSEPCGYCYAYNKVHFDFNEWTPTNVNIGGAIYCYSDSSCPLKSVKIYKITR